MLKTCISSLFILLMMTTQAFCWEMSEFMIYVWGVPKTDNLETKAKALADAGVTIVNWEPDKLDILQKYGLKAMVHNPTPEIAAKLSKHPALWGYHCGDEPYPEDKFPPIAQQFIDLKKSDPNHPAFINMLSTTGDFLRTYMEVVKPEILSYDYYQWWWGSDRYFEKLEQLREAALLADIPLACCLEVTANPEVERGDNTYLADNRLKLRQSVYTALAYGVKGIEWFNASAMFKPESTELTQAGKDVKALNTELKL
ncbi:MAG: hypothetical protein JXB48_14010, partial [Candidatus Latescibacteria bacterium]|nr:hypothetical protein [Candidatus Latescibacterota bacterium]